MGRKPYFSAYAGRLSVVLSPSCTEFHRFRLQTAFALLPFVGCSRARHKNQIRRFSRIEKIAWYNGLALCPTGGKSRESGLKRKTARTDGNGTFGKQDAGPAAGAICAQ